VRQEGSGGSVTLRIEDRDGVMRLGEVLRSAGYEPERMRPMLRAREDDNLTPQPGDIPVILRLLPKGEPLAGLMKLFLLGIPVPEDEVRSALAPLPLDRAVALGVVRRMEGSVAANVRILPAGRLVFASDLELERSPDVAPDHVMSVAGSSILLASLTVRRHVGRALDIGSGSGIQSVLAAMHADHVVACDLNARALNFTAFNALLNGVTNIECRSGSFFEPVGGESFDLIVSNPPFVISPENAITFRDSGMRGDDVSRDVVRGASEHLTEGGLAFVLVNWGLGGGQDWREPLREWVKDLPCDVWFLHQSSDSALLYAAGWNSALQLDPDAYASAIDRWYANLRELGFETIGYGAAIVRKRSGVRNWLRFDDLRGQRSPSSGDLVAQLIEAQDFLAEVADNDRALLDARLTLVPEHRLDQVLRCRNGTFTVEGASLRLESGFRFESAIDAFSAHLLTRLDGRPLSDAIRDAAATFAGDGIGADEFESGGLQFARSMLGLGFVRLVAPA
jgi:methylase of polypeptide subunit release factors